MDSKRKANGHAIAETDDPRSAKRRKLAEFDLSKGESRESTTAYGTAFLEQIRRTQDKSGRLVATYFEKLLPRNENAEYYKRTRMPIALETVEEKLNKGQFKTLAELESYFKRMIANAKEFYPRSSAVFDDAERVRKALSNYMTKNNPAYQTRGYQAVPTPLPPENGEEAEEGGDEEDGDVDAEGEEEEQQQPEEDEEEDEEPASRRRSIILKRTGSGRPSRNSASYAESPKKSKPSNSRPDHEYHNVPYKGLSFQQAQEKLIEELLRYKEPEYDGYFEPFVNLPPRSLRDYYRVISDPLSIKKLQKEVTGVQGRGEPTGVSEYKSWSALEERAKLLWTNAFFYNEEGSEIFDLARELQKAFSEQLKKARAVVPEPAQPKIKLKVGQSTDTPNASKRITIHVGGRTSSVDSPAPQTAQSVELSAVGPPINGAVRQPALEAARSVSVSAPSPSPSMPAGLKAEDVPRMSPAVLPQTPGVMPGPSTPLIQAPIVPSGPAPIQSTDPSINGYVEPKRLRAPNKGIGDALISRLRIQLHPSIRSDSPKIFDVLPHAREMQQSGTMNVVPSVSRVFILVQLPEFIQDRQYSLWVLIDKQPLKPCLQAAPNQLPQEHAFDIMLHQGVNVIEAHLVAAIPGREREPGGPEVELEILNAYVNVLRSWN